MAVLCGFYHRKPGKQWHRPALDSSPMILALCLALCSSQLMALSALTDSISPGQSLLLEHCLFYVLGFTWNVFARIKDHLRRDTEVHFPKPERSELRIVNLLAAPQFQGLLRCEIPWRTMVSLARNKSQRQRESKTKLKKQLFSISFMMRSSQET